MTHMLTASVALVLEVPPESRNLATYSYPHRRDRPTDICRSRLFLASPTGPIMTRSTAAIGIIMPAYNEAPNLVEIVPETVELCRAEFASVEVMVVDDGSTDNTREVMEQLTSEYPEVTYVRLRRNAGKSQALRAGLSEIDADLIALMDADGQDRAESLPGLMTKLDDGFDLVTGRRSTRQDRFVKRVTSRLYNTATSRVTGVEGRDFNSGLKLMRLSVAKSLELYGELHRYIPVLAHWMGFRVAESDVDHRPRLHGETKFGKARFWRGFLDLITVKFLTTFTARPFHLFGSMGAVSGVVGSGLLTWMLIEKLAGNGIGQRPALLTGVLLIVVAVQLISLGLIAELLTNHRETRTSEFVAEIRRHEHRTPQA